MQQQTRPALRLRGLGLRVRRGSDEGSDGTEPALDGGAAARAGGREGADGVVHVVGGKAFLAALRPREHAGPADHVLAREQHHRPLDLGPVREAGRALVVVEPSLLAGRGPAVDALHHDRRPALGLALLLGRPLVLLRALPLLPPRNTHRASHSRPSSAGPDTTDVGSAVRQRRARQGARWTGTQTEEWRFE
eukprot:1117666-Rhodomonas_salina.1